MPEKFAPPPALIIWSLCAVAELAYYIMWMGT